jgi:threonine dehydrogenase-like Zn-dependent dehydrogenase
VDVPTPERQREEYLVRVVEVGVDGTDREINEGLYGSAPPGEDHLIIGHESLGEIVECADETCFQRGSLVVGTVRRPDPQLCLNCRNGEYDFCLNGRYRERGIKERHGYMTELYTERPEFLVSVPEELRAVAVMLEPLSVAEKALRQVQRIQQRIAAFELQRVMITGAGSIGMFAALLSRLRNLETLVYSHGPLRGTRAETIDTIGAHFTDSYQKSLEDAARAFGTPDIIIETTGYSPYAWQCPTALQFNGIACLLSVTGGHRQVEIDSDQINQSLVLGNRIVFGSVSQHRNDFEQGVRDMLAIRKQWPGLLERFVGQRLPLEQVNDALTSKDPSGLKTVLQVAEA